jgi:hypothetical protein
MIIDVFDYYCTGINLVNFEVSHHFQLDKIINFMAAAIPFFSLPCLEKIGIIMYN